MVFPNSNAPNSVSISESPAVKRSDDSTTASSDEDHTQVKVEKCEELTTIDPFEPFPEANDAPLEASRVVTIRSIFVGSILGSLVNASNLYLGLKTGFGFPANLFGAICGFGILKTLSNALPAKFPIFGGYFGPKENSIVQTASVTSGGLFFIFISGVPTLYQMGLLSASPQQDYWKLVTLTFVCAYYGVMFAAPMRNFFLITVAREMNLVFPSFTAVALTVENFHSKATGLGEAKKKIKAMLLAFGVAFVLRVVSQYAVGILWDWHIFTWFYIWGGYHNSALAIESWLWYIEWTPAFIGSGMLVGMNVGISYLAGAILSYGIIGPALVHQGLAVGNQPFVGTEWEPYTIFSQMFAGNGTRPPSPRYWLLWPGVMIMLCSSVAELLVQYKVIATVSKTAWRELRNGIVETTRNRIQLKRSLSSIFTSLPKDAADEQIKWWMWLPGTVLLAVLTCVALILQFQMNVGTSVIALIFGFVLSFMAIQCQGAIDQQPTTAITKAVQLVLGGITKSQGYSIAAAQQINIVGAQVAGAASVASADLLSDFRVGFLLRTPVRQQYVAQILGNIIAIFLSPALFILFVKAYPCIIDANSDTCAFLVPSVSAWRAIALAVTSDTFPVPTSSAICALVLGILSVFLVAFRHLYLTGKKETYRIYVPNMAVIGLSMVIPATCYNIAVAMGAIVAFYWQKKHPASARMYLYAVASGFIAGEGIGGVLNAVFELAEIGGSTYGTNIGCPAESC